MIPSNRERVAIVFFVIFWMIILSSSKSFAIGHPAGKECVAAALMLSRDPASAQINELEATLRYYLNDDPRHISMSMQGANRLLSRLTSHSTNHELVQFLEKYVDHYLRTKGYLPGFDPKTTPRSVAELIADYSLDPASRTQAGKNPTPALDNIIGNIQQGIAEIQDRVVGGEGTVNPKNLETWNRKVIPLKLLEELRSRLQKGTWRAPKLDELQTRLVDSVNQRPEAVLASTANAERLVHNAVAGMTNKDLTEHAQTAIQRLREQRQSETRVDQLPGLLPERANNLDELVVNYRANQMSDATDHTAGLRDLDELIRNLEIKTQSSRGSMVDRARTRTDQNVLNTWRRSVLPTELFRELRARIDRGTWPETSFRDLQAIVDNRVDSTPEHVVSSLKQVRQKIERVATTASNEELVRWLNTAAQELREEKVRAGHPPALPGLTAESSGNLAELIIQFKERKAAIARNPHAAISDLANIVNTLSGTVDGAEQMISFRPAKPFIDRQLPNWKSKLVTASLFRELQTRLENGTGPQPALEGLRDIVKTRVSQEPGNLLKSMDTVKERIDGALRSASNEELAQWLEADFSRMRHERITKNEGDKLPGLSPEKSRTLEELVQDYRAKEDEAARQGTPLKTTHLIELVRNLQTTVGGSHQMIQLMPTPANLARALPRWTDNFLSMRLVEEFQRRLDEDTWP